MQELDTIAVERCFRALVRKLFDTQEEGRSARGFEGVALMSEFFGFPACRFGEKYHAAPPSQVFPIEPTTEAASPEACGLGARLLIFRQRDETTIEVGEFHDSGYVRIKRACFE